MMKEKRSARFYVAGPESDAGNKADPRKDAGGIQERMPHSQKV